jgi:hypothetical protein
MAPFASEYRLGVFTASFSVFACYTRWLRKFQQTACHSLGFPPMPSPNRFANITRRLEDLPSDGGQAVDTLAGANRSLSG